MIIDATLTQTERNVGKELSDPVTFIETLLRFNGQPFRLYDYQKKIARESNWMEELIQLALVMSRQSGKSILVSALCVYYACRYPHAKILILSRTKEQSGLIAKYAREFLATSPILCDMIDNAKTRKSDLVLTNGSVIFDRTMGVDSLNIRGLTLSNYGILVIDEAAYASDSGIKNILPAAYGCSKILVSTPYRKRGFFYDAVNSGEYTVHHVPASRCPRISREEIETMRRLYRPSEFQNEVLATFAQGADCVFDSEAVERAINHDTPLFDAETFAFGDRFPFTSDPNKNYVYSLDVAKTGQDSWVLTIGDLDRKNNSMEVVAYHSWAGSIHQDDDLNVTITDDPNTIIRDIMSYMKRFSCRRFYCDTTSNDYFAHQLLNQYLVPVEKVVWSVQKKERMIEHLATSFRAEKIAIPNDTEMLSQILEFSYDLKRMEDQSEKKLYIKGTRDDMVASLCMLSTEIGAEQHSVGGWIDAW